MFMCSTTNLNKVWFNRCARLLSSVRTVTITSSNLEMNRINYPVSETSHLGQGSSCPDLKPGILRLYSMRFCPYAQRTRLVLAAKNIPNDVVNINLQNKPDWLFVRNPLGKVPCLELDGNIIFESLITADFLDEVYPDPPLQSQDPVQRAKDRMFLEIFSQVIHSQYKVFKLSPNLESAGEMFQKFEGRLMTFDKELSRRGSVYFGGEKPRMLDYMIWPWVERFPIIPILTNGALDIDWNKFPRLHSWIRSMESDLAVKESFISAKNHARFIQSLLSGKADYDMKLEV